MKAGFQDPHIFIFYNYLYYVSHRLSAPFVPPNQENVWFPLLVLT